MSKILYWKELLFGRSDTLRGSVLFACNDDAVEFLATHYDELREHYILDTMAQDVHLAMLNKARTLELAASLGIGTPKFWYVRHSEDLTTILSETTFPVIIKPIHSHLFLKQFKNTKYFSAANENELTHWLEICRQKNVDVIISEWIPGPDHLLCSYFTYITESGEPLFHYTKRVIRRFPANAGLACLHVTEWIPEVADLGWKFFSGVKYRGLGNIEFKRDLRDGKLKVIECNPRFAAPQELITQSGLNIPIIIYNHLIGLPLPESNLYTEHMHMWYPVRDIRAFLELHRRKEITLKEWLKSIPLHHVLPYFRIDDPLPSLSILFHVFNK
ncbi:MAG: carboxylate--amine ligase [Calditrichaeota bacterium]|nr:MAG: carboxylate--amine ligase [Calditrichota bacterium]